jgi:hypothetical protein
MSKYKDLAENKELISNIGEIANAVAIPVFIASLVANRQGATRLSHILGKSSLGGWAISSGCRGFASLIDEHQRIKAAEKSFFVEDDLKTWTRRVLIGASVALPTAALTSLPFNRLPFTRTTSLSGLLASGIENFTSNYDQVDIAKNTAAASSSIGLAASIACKKVPVLVPYSYLGWAAAGIINYREDSNIAAVGSVIGAISVLSLPISRSPYFFSGLTSLVALDARAVSNIIEKSKKVEESIKYFEPDPINRKASVTAWTRKIQSSEKTVRSI